MIKVAGLNEYNQLCAESNNNGIYKTQIISPPVDLNIKVSSLLSFSVYYEHAVWVTSDGKCHAIGFNRDFRIYGLIPKDIFRNDIQFEFQDKSESPRKVLSAVCGLYYTLYMVQSASPDGNPELAFVYHNKNNGIPLFLNINGRKPISLFGGDDTAAVIDSEGSIIVITSSIFDSPSEECQILVLPDGLKAVSVAFCEKTVIALSQCGRLFESNILKNKNRFSWFSEISELRKIECIQISGTFEHCFAVASDGSVYGRGSNSYGKLGFESRIENIEKFTKIISLKSSQVKSAFAGCGHSLFLTVDGKILACGKNNNGQLLLKSGPTKDDFYSPVEVSSVESPVASMVAGSSITAVFAGDEIPPNSPNVRVDDEARKKKQVKKKAKKSENGKEKEKETVTVKLSEVNELIRLNGELMKKNEFLEKKIASLTKKLNETEEKANYYKQKVKSIEKELENEKKKNELKPIQTNQSKFLSIDEVRSYNKVKEIGRGATSEIYKVVHPEHYAMKVINKEVFTKNNSNENDDDDDDNDALAIDVDKMRRFFKEYEILCNLNHRNIIKTFGFFIGDESNRPFILLEFCQSDLSKSVKKLSSSQQVSVIFEIADAMQHVHKLGIIHRDLKPENILIDSNISVKVSDFGISTLISLETQTQTRTSGVGTLKFMAPELLNESGKYDEKVDVYAFGVVAYFVLTKGEYPKISIVDVGNGKMAKIPSSINEFSRNLIRKCWSKSASERPSFAEIVSSIRKNKFRLIDDIDAALFESI